LRPFRRCMPVLIGSLSVPEVGERRHRPDYYPVAMAAGPTVEPQASRTAPSPFLTDAEWLLIADLFPDPPVSPEGGRPRISSRQCLERILWILTSGSRWKDLPERYPSPSTCWRREVEHKLQIGVSALSLQPKRRLGRHRQAPRFFRFAGEGVVCGLGVAG
jgi:transposase